MRIILITLTFFVSLTINAQTISTDRPTQAFGTYTMDKGLFQIETGVGMDVYKSAHGLNIGFTQLRYGVLNNFELRTGIGLRMDKSTAFPAKWSSTMISGFKWRIVSKDVEFSYLAEAIVPISPSLVKTQQALLLGHNVSEKISLSYMLMHQYDFDLLKAADYYGNAQFSLVANFQLMEKLTYYMEMSVMWNSLVPDKVSLLYDSGIMYLLKDNLQLDLYFGVGILQAQGSFGVGISWFPPKKEK